jgi:hypothetical protein
MQDPSAGAPPTPHQLRSLASDLRDYDRRINDELPVSDVPRGRLPCPIPWPAWADLVEMMQCLLPYRDEGEAPLPCDCEPGSEGKIRELRRRLREGLSLFGPRDRALAHPTSPGRAVARLATALAAERHRAARAACGNTPPGRTVGPPACPVRGRGGRVGRIRRADRVPTTLRLPPTRPRAADPPAGARRTRPRPARGRTERHLARGASPAARVKTLLSACRAGRVYGPAARAAPWHGAVTAAILAGPPVSIAGPGA